MPLVGAMNPNWQMVLTGPVGSPLTTPTNLGEIAFASDRKFTFNLNKASTIEFRMDQADPTAARVLGQVAVGGHILLYRKGVLQMVTELSTFEASGDGEGNHQYSVVATETMWPRLQGFLAGNSTAGLAGPTVATDQGTWLLSQLTSYNAFGVTHTSINAGTATASNNITGGKWYAKPFLELVQEFSATVAGFDFWQTPVDPIANAGVTGLLNMAPLKGTTKNNVAFEYGTGRRNASSYNWKVDNTMTATAIYSLPDDFPNNAALPLLNAADATAYNLRGFRAVIQPSDLTNTTLRQGFINEALAVRKQPRQQFEIQPSPDVGDGSVPQFGVDYTTGDRITARVSDQNIALLSGLVRVYGAEIAISSEGVETTTLTLINN